MSKDNMVGSVGFLKRIQKLLNILRKKGFAKAHQQRKGDALNPLGNKGKGCRKSYLSVRSVLRSL
jgi:hypothetical protein